MDLKCPKCGIHYSRQEAFCSTCGTPLGPDHNDPWPDDSFGPDASDIFDALNDFRVWIDQRKKTNVGFMKAYKKRLGDIGPAVKQFEQKYSNRKIDRVRQLQLIREIFSCLRRPVRFMETKLRPSVGMGVWQERWMMTAAVEEYLQACCREADDLIDELMNHLSFLGKAR